LIEYFHSSPCKCNIDVIRISMDNMSNINFVEKETLSEANEVDLNVYTFLDRMSARRGSWCFKIREKKR